MAALKAVAALETLTRQPARDAASKAEDLSWESIGNALGLSQNATFAAGDHLGGAVGHQTFLQLDFAVLGRRSQSGGAP
ncbi:hypothetical protein ACIA98_36020 [Streptomyces sp. NPDC051366]|uniref:hypothetical protein n=1 Tax=Streptomyces sp. NPDC051366 TaxID=3365652 RepID=UPI0037BD0C12